MSGEKFFEALHRIHYPNVNKYDQHSFDWLFENKALVPFLEWFSENVDIDSIVTQTELNEFNQLKNSKDGILEGSHLNMALQNLLNLHNTTDINEENLKKDISYLEEELKKKEEVKHSLSDQRNKMTMHLASLTESISKVSQLEPVIKKQLKEKIEQAHTDNEKMNEILSNIADGVKKLMQFYNSILKKTTDVSESVFISQLDLTPYLIEEGRYTEEMKKFMQKQFFEDIKSIDSEEQTDSDDFLQVNRIEDLLVRGKALDVSKEESLEIKRQQSLFASSETERINALVEERSTSAACEYAERKLRTLEEQLFHFESDELKLKLSDAKNTLRSSESDLNKLADLEIPRLIRESLSLELIDVLKADYDLKIARQDYLNRNQDKLIGLYLDQQMRFELFSLLLDEEFETHCRTHRLLSAITNLFDQNFKSFSDRMNLLSEMTTIPSKFNRETVDSKDKFMVNIHKIISNNVSDSENFTESAKLFLTYPSIVENAENLNKEITTVRTKLSSDNLNYENKLSSLQNLLKSGESMLFKGANTSNVQTYLSAPLVNTFTELQSLSEKLNQNVIDIKIDVEKKQKELQVNRLQRTERNLFVQFFNNPEMLKQTINDAVRKSKK